MIELIQKSIAQRDLKIEAQLVDRLPQGEFTIYEDLHLIQVELQGKVLYRHFVQLAQQLETKTIESLRNRYITSIRYLNEQQLELITKYLTESQNMNAFLNFQGQKFIGIVPVELIAIQQQIIQNKEKHQNEPKIQKKIKQQDMPYYSQHYQLSELQLEMLYSNEILHEELRFPTNESLTQQERYQQEYFQNTIHDLSLWYDLSMNTLNKLLFQCSGNFIQLKCYLEDKNSNVLWNEDDDQILENGQIPPYKSTRDVDRRKQWLRL